MFSPVLLLILWEVLVRARLVDSRFVPAPTSIAATFGGLVLSKELPLDVRDTVGRVAVGFCLGAIPGVALGIVMGLSRVTRTFVKPIIAALYPIPKIAILPLIMMIFGLGEASKYVSVAIAVVFVVLINTMRGVMNIDRIYIDVGRNFGAGRLDFYRTVALPGALPAIFTGFQLSLGVGLIAAVAAEFVASRSGIGYLIWNSWQTFAVERMYSGLIVIALLGFATQMLLDRLQRWAIPWKPEV